MQKTSEMLLILTPEEKSAAQKFVEQRIRTFDAEHVDQIQELAKLSAHQIRRLQVDKRRIHSASRQAAKITMKLYDVALSGLSFIIGECKKSEARIEHSVSGPAEDSTPEDSAEEAKKLALKTTLEEEDLALDYIKQSMEKLRVSDLRVFREACQHLLTWWESDRGQVHGLLIEQHGDVNTAAGRMVIRKKRERMGQRVLQPFKEFYHELNVHYQKTSKEMSTKKRQNGSPAKEKPTSETK
jgi:hypothetical protein